MINNKTETKQKKEQTYDCQVKRAVSFDWGISFDLKVNGVTIYNMIHREGVKDGKPWSMVTFPSHQGKDGKWYNYCWFKISDELLETIEKQLADMLK